MSGWRSDRCALLLDSRQPRSSYSRSASAPAPRFSRSSTRSSCAGCRSTTQIGSSRCRRRTRHARGLAGGSSAPQNFLEWRAQQDVFEAIGASSGAGGFTIRGDGPPEDLRALRTTANLFSILRVRPAIGQPYSEANEVDGNHRVMLISDGLWRRRFNADPDVVGKTMTFESGTWQVVGVMPAEFRYPIGPARATDLWVPYVVAERDKVRGPGRSYFLNVVARLKPGATLEQARARMEQITAGLATAHPTWFQDRGIATVTLHDYIVGANVKSWMLMLLGAVGFVLLIACVNVANLMLARASARGRDVSIRAALGASRWQLARGLLVESLVLSCAGTLIGVAIAYWAVEVLRASLPATLPRLSLVAIDVRVLAIAALVSVVTALLFGIVPALQASRPTLSRRCARAAGRAPRACAAAAALSARGCRGGPRGRAARRRRPVRGQLRAPDERRPRHGRQQHADDPRVSARGVRRARSRCADGARRRRRDERVRPRCGTCRASRSSRSAPARCRSAAGCSRSTFKVAGKPDFREGDDAPDTKTISPDYFKALAVPLLAGRHVHRRRSRGDRGAGRHPERRRRSPLLRQRQPARRRGRDQRQTYRRRRRAGGAAWRARGADASGSVSAVQAQPRLRRHASCLKTAQATPRP